MRSGETAPANVTTASAAAARACARKVTAPSLRRSRRSARPPAYAESTRAGPRITSASAPTAAGLPVSCRISQPPAIICSQEPALDARLASQTLRNSGTRSTWGTGITPGS